MRTWMVLSAAALGLMTGAADAADEAPAEENEEVQVAEAHDQRVEEVVARAKRRPAMEHVAVGRSRVEPELTLSTGRIEIARPEIGLPAEEEPQAE